MIVLFTYILSAFQKHHRAVENSCWFLQVSLTGGASYYQGSRQEVYVFTGSVNGKLCWKSSNHAIWYVPAYNEWAIGKKSRVGTK